MRAGPAAPTHREHGVGEFSNMSPGPLAKEIWEVIAAALAHREALAASALSHPVPSCPRCAHPSPSFPRWVFLYEKGYQSQDSIVSSVSVKLKGITLTNESVLGPHIWDVVDYVFPPQVRRQEGLGGLLPPRPHTAGPGGVLGASFPWGHPWHSFSPVESRGLLPQTFPHVVPGECPMLGTPPWLVGHI